MAPSGLRHKAFTVLMNRLWLEDDLGITLDTLVEFVIGSGCVVERHIIGDDKTGFRSASNDQVTQIAVVALHIALSGAKTQTLLKEFAK